MTTVRRVVVAYDGSPSSDAALAAGVEEARDADVPLLLVTAVDVDPTVPEPFTHLPRATSEAVAGAIAKASAALGGTDRVVSTVAVGAPAAVVLQTLDAGDLAVLGSHSRSLLGRALIGSTSRAVATHAQVPVLVVRAGRSMGKASGGGPVVVGVDGSELSTAATRFAAREAETRGVELRAVTALPPRRDDGVVGPDHPSVQQAEAALGQSLAGLRQDHPDLEVTPLVVQASATDALLHHAHGASLLVVGSRGLTGLRAVALGSVSRHVLDLATCSVAVVR